MSSVTGTTHPKSGNVNPQGEDDRTDVSLLQPSWLRARNSDECSELSTPDVVLSSRKATKLVANYG